jgi:hypothetical protein
MIFSRPKASRPQLPDWQTLACRRADCLRQGFLSLAGQHQQRQAADSGTGLQVAQRIANRRYALEVGIHDLRNALEHARLGLAAGAVGIRRVRAVKNRIDPTTDGEQGLVHLFMDAVQRIHIEQRTPNARLIGRNHHLVAALVELGDGFQAAGNRLPFRRALDELGGIDVDDAVAVEDDEFHADNLERSATWFIAACSLASRPRRLARRPGRRH